MAKAVASGKSTPATLKPYLAPVLLKAVGPERDARLLTAVVAEITGIGFASSGRVSRQLVESSDLGRTSNFHFHVLIYSERAAPIWNVGSIYENLTYELIVIAVQGDNAVLCMSDGTARQKIVKRLQTVRLISPDAITKFVGAEAAAIWLDGIHPSTSIRPDTKFITGRALEYALDPLGDQTYRYSAIRSHPDVAGLDVRGKRRAVGASPEGGRLWVGRPDTWSEFGKQLDAILKHALSGHIGSDLYGILAKPTTDINAVKDAYGVAIMPPALLSEEAIDEAQRELARRWANDTRFTVLAGKGASLEVEPILDGQNLGRISLTINGTGQDVVIGAAWITQPAGFDDERKQCAEFLTDPDTVKIYYDSGHTLAQGRFYESGFIDQVFEEWDFVDMSGFDVDREKPLKKTTPKGKGKKAGRALDVAAIGNSVDSSLFGFVVRQLFPTGWLACDDGSMELADFVHIDPGTRTITLIHAKGSGSIKPGRSVSVSDYEIVVSQAIKNLRHLHRYNLHVELARGKGKKIGAAVWENGVRQPDRSGFLAAAKALPASAPKRLIILQPSLTKTEHQASAAANASRERKLRMKQLNALMLSAKLSASACGVELKAVAAV